MHIAILRLRGRVGVRGDVEDTMRMLGLKKKHSLAIIQKSPSLLGMIKKSEDYITWGEVGSSTLEKLKGKNSKSNIYHLAPPKRGFRSLKSRWPKGDLGRRDNMDGLIERML